MRESAYTYDDVVSTFGSNVSSVTGTIFQGYTVADLVASLLPTSIDEKMPSDFAETSKQPAQATCKPEHHSPYDPASEGSAAFSLTCNYHQTVTNYASGSRRNNVSLAMSQLNCFKSRERVAALACCPSKDSRALSVSGFRCCNTKDWKHHHPPLHAVDEEETGHDKPDSSCGPTSQHRRTESQPDLGFLHANQHRRTKSQQQQSSEAVWISNIELDEHAAMYVTRGKKRFLRLEI